ncbi:MAG: prolipoprotein diacylglyceryl transferase [Patescibacteria group bacterium]|nr:prolipoprotein diacylglyceryl transferase [Patescibacteria group bacterium]
MSFGLIKLLHTYHPQPILFEFKGVVVYWYGFFIVVGILLGLGLILYLAKKYHIHSDHVWQLVFYLLIFGLVGARIYHVLCEMPYYLYQPLDILKFWQGGMGIFGGVIAGVAVVYFYTRKYHLPFWLWLDILVVGLIVGQAMGRWGNYFNQELYGLPTILNWGIPIDVANRVDKYVLFQFFHPTFLYQSIWNCLACSVLLISHAFRFKKIIRGQLIRPGIIFTTYVWFYSVGRFMIEFLRIDRQPEFGMWRLGHISSLILIITAIVITCCLKKRKMQLI